MKVCSVADCDREAKTRGWCRMHYGRWRATGDPLRKSRFDTVEEKNAYIAQERAERRARQARQREERKAQEERLRLLQTRAVQRIGPSAAEMVEAIDNLPAEERAAVVSLAVSLLFGRNVDIDIPVPTRGTP